MSQRSSTDKAPITEKARTINQTLGEACVVLVKRRPRGKARRPQFPRLLLRWYSADQSLSFTLRQFEPERSVGPKGRHSYATAPTAASWETVERRPGWDRGCVRV